MLLLLLLLFLFLPLIYVAVALVAVVVVVVVVVVVSVFARTSRAVSHLVMCPLRCVVGVPYQWLVTHQRCPFGIAIPDGTYHGTQVP